MSRASWPRLAAVALGLCAGTVFGPTGAGAADLPARMAPLPPPPVLPIFTWTGFYLGVQGGYEAAYDRLDELVTADRSSTGLVYRYAPDGFVGGGHVGANYQLRSFVVGIEGDVEGATLRGSFDAAPLGKGHDDINWRASVRGRVGYTIGPVLLYATGGVAFAGLDATYVFVPTNTSETIGKTLTGWTVGGGLAYALNDHWFVTGEYRHTDYGRVYNDSLVAFPGLTGAQHIVSDSGEVGISYRF